MAASSQIEQIREMKTQIAVLTEQVKSLNARIEDAHIIELIAKIAVLENQLTEIRDREKENDRRRWQFWLGVGVVVITFVANLTINLLMFFAKKPA